MTESQQLARIVAVAGAALLAVSVFLPWYSVKVTADGAAFAQVALNEAASRYGNATLQAEAKTVGSVLPSAAGHKIGTVTAHQYLKKIGVILLALAALTFLGALLWLAQVDDPLRVDGGQVAAAGGAALLLVLFRMVDRPTPALFSLSLDWGAWLALLASCAIVAGGLLGRTPQQRRPVGFATAA